MKVVRWTLVIAIDLLLLPFALIGALGWIAVTGVVAGYKHMEDLWDWL